MAKIDFDAIVPLELESVAVEIREAITKAGKYCFEIVKAERTNSRILADGSPKEHLPNYTDATEEIYLLLKDILTGKTHSHRMALQSFRKFSSFSATDVRDNKLTKDTRDGYALRINKTGDLVRIPDTANDGYEAVLNIFSRFTQAIGMPEGTSANDCKDFEGKFFRGVLVDNHYTANDGSEKDRLKLQPTFYPINEAELDALQSLAGKVQSFE